MLGNVAVTTGPTVVVDTVAPTLSFTGPTGVVGGPTSATVEAVVTATDGRPDAGVTVDIVDFDGVSGPAAGPSPFRRTVHVPMVDYQQRSLRARARDGASNTAETPAYSVFVDRVAPQVTFQAPTPGLVVNLASAGAGASFPVQLRSSDASPTSQFYLRVTGGAGTGNEQQVSASSSVNTSAVDNGATYTLSARAVDQAGNEGPPVVTTVVVDRVRPTASFNIANMARLTTTRLEATFSEPMTSGSSPIVTTPSIASSFATPTSAVANLENYSVYTASIATGLTDIAGNSLMPPSSIRFSTEVRMPATDLLATNIGTFDVVAEQDGVPLFVLQSNNGALGTLSIIRYDPKFAITSPASMLPEHEL